MTLSLETLQQKTKLKSLKMQKGLFYLTKIQAAKIG